MVDHAPIPVRRLRNRAWALGALALGLLTLAGGACKRRDSGGGDLTPGQADQYLDRAVRKSSEGVVFFPSEAAQRDYDMQRLNEVAQSLRTPFALCFVQQAIARMTLAEVDGEVTYTQVPEGQSKIRARIAQSGEVVSTEVLDSGFKDPQMLACVESVIAEKRFPTSKSGFNKHIDIVYWVSLGFFAEARSEAFRDYMRREQTKAAIRARSCLEGRIAPGHYEVEGLNLFDRNGNTIANRVEPGGLDEGAVKCLSTTFKSIRIHEEKEAFIRPASPRTVLDVADDGTISVLDEQWLRLLELEEAAQRDERRRELLGSDQEAMGGPALPADPRSLGEVPPPEVPENEDPSPKPTSTHEEGGAIRLGPR